MDTGGSGGSRNRVASGGSATPCRDLADGGSLAREVRRLRIVDQRTGVVGTTS